MSDSTIPSPTRVREAKRRVVKRKYGGDDRYSWALFIDGHPVMTGMDSREAQWRRATAIRNLAAGRNWSDDGR